MKYFSMFSGIGGFEYGINQATNNKWNCIGFSEIDKFATQIYQQHFPKHKNYGDCTKINTELLPEFDLLCGGFPCQAFSLAGKRMGFKDTRGTLYFEIARIIKARLPRFLFLENVKGLLNHDSGRTFTTILATLDELGYDAEWEVLNSKHFGVAQNRERVFIIGHLRGTSSKQVFPIGKGSEELNGRDAEKQVASSLQNPGHACGNYKGMNMLELTKCQSQGNRIYDDSGISQTLAAKGGGRGAKTGLYQVHNLQPRSPDRPSLKKNPKAGGSGHLQREDTSYCIDDGNTNAVEFKDKSIRRLTPVECERLQGFPDGWTEGLSDTQRYKCLGNAVTTNVITAIVEKWESG